MAEAFGLAMHDLPDGAVPIGVMACVKFFDADGNIAWALRTSSYVNMMEGLGMATAMYQNAVSDASNSWRDLDG